MPLTVSELQAVFGLDTKPFESKLDGLKGKIGRAGPALMGAAAIAGAGVAAALGQAIERGRIQDRLAAQLGLTEAQSEQAGKIAGDLYSKAYGESLQQVTDAVGAVMSSMDVPTDQVDGLAKSALNLASTFEVDVARSAQVAGQMLTTGLAKDGTQAMDLLTASMQRVPAAVREDLLDAVDEYSPMMANLGLSGEKAMGLLVGASEKGMYGIDKLGDSLKEFQVRSTDMTAASKVGYDALGMSQEDMTNRLLAGGDTAGKAFGEIVTGLQGIEDPAAQSQAALALFGTPLEDLSVSEIPKFLSSLSSAETGLEGVDGAAAGLDKTLNDNAATSWTEVRRQALGLTAELGERLLPAADSVTRYLADAMPGAMDRAAGAVDSTVGAVRTLTGWLTDHARVIGVVAGVIATIMIPHWVALAAASVKSSTIQAASWLKTQAGAARAAVVHSGAVVKMVAGWVLAGAQSLIQAGRMAAAWFIAMGPVGWVIAAVIGLVALIVANWDTVVKYTRIAWDWVVDKIKTGWEWLVNMFQTYHPVGIIISHWDDIVAATQKTWDWVTGKIGDAWDWVQQKVYDATVWVLTTLVTWYGNITTATSDAWDWVTGKIGDAWEWIKTTISTAAGNVATGLQASWDTITGAVGTAWDWITSKISGVWTDGIKPVLDTLMKVVKEDVPAAFTAGKDALGAAWDAVKALAAKPINFVIDTVYNGGLRGLFNKVADVVGIDARLPKLQTVKTRATGGYTPAGMTLVGEQGPELLDMQAPGRVYTARQTRDMMRTDAPEEQPVGGFMDEVRSRLSTAAQIARLQVGLAASGDVSGAAGIGVAGLRAGAGALRDYVAAGVRGLLDGVPAAGMLGDLVKGAGRSLVDGLLAFAKGQDGKADRAAAAAAASGGGGGFSGPLPPVVGGWMRPGSGGTITSEFGMRTHPITGRRKLHNGIDVAGLAGSVVRAMQAGRVVHAGRMGTYGNFVQVAHQGGYQTGYAHLARVLTSVGATVSRGQRIGVEGATGGVTGKHLHQNVRLNGAWINPRRLGVYDTGGYLEPGFTMAYNGTGKRERIRTAEQEADVQRRLKAAEGTGVAPLIGSLTMHTRAERPRDVVAELSHELRVLRRGGRTVGAR